MAQDEAVLVPALFEGSSGICMSLVAFLSEGVWKTCSSLGKEEKEVVGEVSECAWAGKTHGKLSATH